jgi:hypothetical protein
MRTWIAAAIVVISGSAWADKNPGRFIPWSPLTEEEFASQ